MAVQIEDITVGTRVIAVAGAKNTRFPVNFPGWGTPNAADTLLPWVEGMTGVVSFVESHGMNPWTRFSVRWSDGTRSSGIVPTDLLYFA